MTQLKIADINFCETVLQEEGGITGGRITPRVFTAAATASDTFLDARANRSGDLASGFTLNLFGRGSAASAAASAVSLGGQASANAYANANE
ncbi:MAG: hypothetical protein KME06_03080 [Kastovskya adunca ATA6-11-RM4]|jgi:hypothetical protein|nr:hypothetical protein [Kastovskya adunca ATA6-11-RM4]